MSVKRRGLTWSFVTDIAAPGQPRHQVRRGGFGSEFEALAAEEQMQALAARTAPRVAQRSAAYYRAAAVMLYEDLTSFASPPAGDDARYVYGIVMDQHIKIGWSKHPELRLGELRRPANRTRKPEDLTRRDVRLLGVLLGPADSERQVQHLARNFWVRGEWYLAHEALTHALVELFDRHGIREAS